MISLSSLAAQAQITIGGNVYGGGNMGPMDGKTSVTVRAGNIHGAVYAGACQANVGKTTFVHIDGQHMSDDIIINQVYGGNDIAGVIGRGRIEADGIPSEVLSDTVGIGISKTCLAFVLTTKEIGDKHIFIGQLFGGGNGDYDYKNETLNENIPNPYYGMRRPEISKTFLDIKGGTIGYLFGGGNNATVTETTNILINNTSSVTTNANLKAILNTDDAGVITRMAEMGLNTVHTQVESGDYQFGRVFGGNNKAAMAIRPKWHLKSGRIRDLYSGGNAGNMTFSNGIFLPIREAGMTIHNVYGGCRMADVNPDKNDIQPETIDGTYYPANYASRVLIEGGDIDNVYGGNDVSGNVYGGNAIGIHSNINNDVYGGGNGSYAYTDKESWKNSDEYGDFYYDPGESSIDSLNAFRPNAEAVSIRVVGRDERHPTIIGGAIYCGGNSATLRNDDPNKRATAQLKIGSYVIADKVFLGNNGENIVSTETLQKYADRTFSSLDLQSSTIFEKYMDGVAMMIEPEVVFDDVGAYVPYSTMFGSFFCGGNVGSMKIDRALNISFNDKVVVYDKVVGGSNSANVYQSAYNAQYLGGLIGNADTNGNKLILNFGGLKIQPKRWVDVNDKSKGLTWNTVDSRTFNTETKKYIDMDPVPPTEEGGTVKPYDENTDPYRRFQGGNIYGGCYSNGHVNGNVVINLNASIVDRKGDNAIFDQVEEVEGEAKLYDENYNITRRYTGVLLSRQGMDPLGRGLNVFGGGYGTDSEIWGSTTINLNAGYTFQIFGGGEQGAIGRADSSTPNSDDPTLHTLHYSYDSKYSTHINLKGATAGTYRGDKDEVIKDDVIDTEDMAEAEFIYGGSFEGAIAGNTILNLGNGRIFNSFAGSCNADILGHTETYIGRNSDSDSDLGFPWIRDHTYGGNDLGGRILGNGTFKNRVSNSIMNMVYNPKNLDVPDVLKASAYTEFIQGRVEYIFGGCYGDYDYTDSHYNAYTNTNGSSKLDKNGNPIFFKPWMDNAFVNFKPNNNGRNAVTRIYGAGQGHAFMHVSDADRDKMQDRSYILVDSPQDLNTYQNTDIFGAGDYSGVGMRNDATATPTIPALTPAIAQNNANGVTASTVIDLIHGTFKDVYGASYKEGITRRTIVNVPTASSIHLTRIFGGAYGISNDKPCDVYESNINYYGSNAVMEGYWIPADMDTDGNLASGGIYGGNNNARRTLYSRMNIHTRVLQDKTKGYEAKIFGAGYGKDTWAQYTEVNLEDGASVYEAYGGGYGGMVLNKESVIKADFIRDLPSGYTDDGLDCYLVKENPLGLKTNTNVYINKGVNVTGYCYGGGLGADATVSGTTYIGLHGGHVSKDIYAAGWGGAVYDKYKVAKDDNPNNDFIATTNVFIEGGEVRNVYGGGYEGAVGHTEMETTTDPGTGKTTTIIKEDIPGESNVIIGIRKDRADLATIVAPYTSLNFFKGIPAIERNAYGAGEGGAVYGTSNLIINNGYIGYVFEDKEDETYDSYSDHYKEKIDDETWKVEKERAGRLKDCGNAFGGGYDDKSTVDTTHVTMWGGMIRSSLYGGGEIATVGRGKTRNLSGLDRGMEAIYKYGKTNIEMYNGHVQRNVFGGGKGYNILGYGGTNELYTDGYVFGQTEVHIHGGEVGTTENVDEKKGGYGNVFGGGDVGFVYGKGYFSTKTNSEKNISTGSPGHHYFYDDNGNLTEDCKVVIAPYLQVKDPLGFTINGRSYQLYDYVDTDVLNMLPKKDKESKLYVGGWEKFYTGDKLANGEINPNDPVERGVIIRNAVFAGGNVSSNSDKTYANAPTVFGNSTATIYDCYHRDFITVGTEHIGGVYGGGNLSLVEGYRELNITNYGTDYYGQDDQITLEDYRKLSNRERAYFKLQYVCMKEYTNTTNNKTYSVNDKIDEDDYKYLIDSEYKTEEYWQQYGFCSIYAGRLLNTIQRADLCGVFGSRMVLQGAKDRVASVGNSTVYTINRVGELSLNQQRTVRKAGVVTTPDTEEDGLHGNYFGIYSVVNYLGNLTSDVHFTDTLRKIENEKAVEDENYSYLTWKTDNLTHRDRNNGTAFNQVALASGVFLELTTEKSTPSKKDYGYITGIVELDLINIKKDIEGGGYVYARNEHGVPKYYPNKKNVVLSEYNEAKSVNINGINIGIRDELCTYKCYYYKNKNLPTGDEAKDAEYIECTPEEFAANTLREYQTSGNFIHKRKRIVDDCYPNNGIYNDGYVQSPAHYWYIKGEVYIYDQTLSAYAGSASAYSKEVKIPLTITAASNGQLKLLNVQPNRYAYFSDYTRSENKKITTDGIKVDNERTTLHLNDVMSWWDWNQLTDDEQLLFVKETYVNVDTCYVDGVFYPAGTYVLENDPSIHSAGQKTAYETFKAAPPTITDQKGSSVTVTQMFHSSNNISHDTGYVLTFDMDSPSDWDDWYSPEIINSGTEKMNKKDYKEYNGEAKYIEGPTFYLNGADGLYGQHQYDENDIISKEVYNDYTTTVSQMTTPPTNQASVDEAYIALDDYIINDVTVIEGNPISKTVYSGLSAEAKTHFDRAMLCINTIQLGEEEFILNGDLVAENQMESIAQKYFEFNNSQHNTDQVTMDEARSYIRTHLSEAYICTSDGLYGGQFFKSGTNYSALKAWCSLTNDRTLFNYNYDAFDLLIEPNYPGEDHTYKYDGITSASADGKLYSDIKPVDYAAAYTKDTPLTYYDNDGTEHTISKNDAPLSREDYEKIKNEQVHYTRIEVAAGGQDIYIVKENFIDRGTPYAKGQDITLKDYNSLLTANKALIKTDRIANDEAVKKVMYYRFEPDGNKPAYVAISSDDFKELKNYQKEFVIQGKEPTQTSTLYVSRESNAKDVTSEKIITVVYQYTYYEGDQDGEGVSMNNELHIVNIHLKLESGAPEIGQLSTPPVVLPGNKVGLKAPTVNPGLYEILTNGWEMFTDEQDAIHHRNGTPFYNNRTKLYWYQNQKTWISFYSKTYLGKTYSNPVLLTVANYHDLDDVMADKAHHMYVDHKDVDHASKIYIDNRECKSDETKSELDLLKDFFDLSLINKSTPGITLNDGDSITNEDHKLKDHTLLNSRVKGGDNLEFILNSDVSPMKYTEWTPIGDDSQCFMGSLHGDGYTISGLNHSLFGRLCGNVYNLGVTGSFTSAGIADEGDGYIENCWVKSSAKTMDANTKAVFGNPSDNSRKQVVNCYYWDQNEYATGDVRPMTEREFYNGTVAYNLNGFYLNKRYYDGIHQATGQLYHYFKPDTDGNLTDVTSHYPTTYEAKNGSLGYVEDRYEDGDFRYAAGKIPDSAEKRQRLITVTTAEGEETFATFAPIWPDDYLFFGQMLTYGYDETYAHEDTPSHIVKHSGTIPFSKQSNRVYRAPAYYRSKTQSVAHFNPWCYLAAFSAPKSITDTSMKPVYPNMTAIDFKGHNDAEYKVGLNGSYFFQPLLDDGGLLNISNNGETPNLLVYAPLATDNPNTYDVLTGDHFIEPVFEDYHEAANDGHNYNRVTNASVSGINGHLVLGDLTTLGDHLLVDKKDFNAPIAYTMGSDKRMWYQRTPDNFVNRSSGWEVICLPFTTETVTTQDKGELTHFYEGQTKGHEYWLREYAGNVKQKKDATDKPVTGVYTADFNPLSKGNNTKEYDNTFLFDYYYSQDAFWDKNTDEYQKQYYSTGYLNELYPLSDYPFAEAGTPYLVGFPGATYYEFDLSGTWTPANRYLDDAITSPGKQTITFVSEQGVEIGVSDDETVKKANGEEAGVSESGYTFKPTFLNNPEIETDQTVFLLNTDGNSFNKTNAGSEAITAFRPYFLTATPAGSRSVQQIIFGQSNSQFGIEDQDPSKDDITGNLIVRAKRKMIVVESTLNYTTSVRISSTAGLTIAVFDLEPGQTVETPINASGIYIIQSADGKFNKKLTTKK